MFQAVSGLTRPAFQSRERVPLTFVSLVLPFAPPIGSFFALAFFCFLHNFSFLLIYIFFFFVDCTDYLEPLDSTMVSLTISQLPCFCVNSFQSLCPGSSWSRSPPSNSLVYGRPRLCIVPGFHNRVF